ncbi:uncharacterized protein LOC129634267 isoform X10 [Bubalus kerabau]|uniref:uncharacterized protein LOC129634267 isoform X10 n=1 Tax=Bubalus carabanensis TaxID=3119969 RepID=UPI00244E8109|nr:uncharacterized protein LOC129634267 isoform X10 [Bubalus carabanensis]
MDLRDIFEQHCDWIQPGTTVLRKGDPQENISARKDLLTKFNGCSSDICINEGEKKKDPSLMEKEYPWVVKGLKAHTRQVGRLWLEPREPECTGTLTTADCLWLLPLPSRKRIPFPCDWKALLCPVSLGVGC